jgi:hypothetical protein
LHPAAESIGSRLRLGKRPIAWVYRPTAWPEWNHQNRRLARFWSADEGHQADVLEALRQRRLETLPVVEALASDLLGQLTEELAASRHHLQQVLDRYWEPDWRREHKRYEDAPEDHLWRAAQAVREIEDALAELAWNSE